MYVATIQLLIRADSEAEAYDAVAEGLRNLRPDVFDWSYEHVSYERTPADDQGFRGPHQVEIPDNYEEGGFWRKKQNPLLEALNQCITDDGAACLTREDLRGLEYARRRLHEVNAVARAAIAAAEGR